jgi:hypothetical protein
MRTDPQAESLRFGERCLYISKATAAELDTQVVQSQITSSERELRASYGDGETNDGTLRIGNYLYPSMPRPVDQFSHSLAAHNGRAADAANECWRPESFLYPARRYPRCQRIKPTSNVPPAADGPAIPGHRPAVNRNSGGEDSDGRGADPQTLGQRGKDVLHIGRVLRSNVRAGMVRCSLSTLPGAPRTVSGLQRDELIGTACEHRARWRTENRHVSSQICARICARDAAGRLETGETRSHGRRQGSHVRRGQREHRRPPKTAETEVVRLITQRSQVQILPPLPRSRAGSRTENRPLHVSC